MPTVQYGDGTDTSPQELAEFYQRLKHDIAAQPEQLGKMMDGSAAFVTARVGGRLIGLARGVCDGLRGYLTECKLDPGFQGPAAVTRTDGRIEHDTAGIAEAMACRVLARMFADGIRRVDVVAWGTEVDFLEDLGFRKQGGLVGMTMRADDWPGSTGAQRSSATHGRSGVAEDRPGPAGCSPRDAES
jgi:hypothetical protein